MKRDRGNNGTGAGHDSDIESPPLASPPRQPPVANTGPKQSVALRQLELQHELERVQMQLQFEHERREWAQGEAMLLRGQLLRYEGTVTGESAPKQSGQSNDTQGTTRQWQLAILVN